MGGGDIRECFDWIYKLEERETTVKGSAFKHITQPDGQGECVIKAEVTG